MKLLIAILGKSGSGKDYIAKEYCSRYSAHMVKRFTSRPMREGESQGSPYLFVDRQDLMDDYLSNEMDYIELNFFNDWIYATHKDSLEGSKNVITVDDEGLKQILQEAKFCSYDDVHFFEDVNMRVLPFYLDVEDKIRLLRQLSREGDPDIDEIIRRYQSEKNQYIDILDYNLVYTTDVDEIINIIEKAVDKIKQI